MLVLAKTAPAPGLDLVQRDVPEPGSGEVLIRVLRTGICGTDLHIEAWDPWAASTIRPPLVPGHEFVGEVVALGADVQGIRIGAIASGEGHLVCGTCRNCRAGRRHLCVNTIGLGVDRDGAFAQYLTLPASNVWVHGDDIDLDLAAIFDPFGNAVHTALKFPLVGEDILITGAGPIGLMAVAVARHVGARYIVVTDVSEPRLELARRMGADLAIDVSRERVADAQRRLGMREGFDVGLEMSGKASALSEMVDNLTHGGRVAMLGLATTPIDIDWAKVVTHMITISGIYGREMFETWYAMTTMLQSSSELRDALRLVVSHRHSARNWETAFATAHEGRAGKVVLDWSEA
jgi:threonine 3-dehydrogenase